MRTGIIYKLNCINNEFYLYGSTINFYKRKDAYLRELKQNKYKNQILQACFNKYGIDSIKFELIVDNIPEDILKDIENIYIGSGCGRAEDKKRGMNLKDANRNRYSIYTIQKMRIARLGKKLSDETSSKIANSNRSLSPEMLNLIIELNEKKYKNKDIAYLFNIDTSQISRILNGRNGYRNIINSTKPINKNIKYKLDKNKVFEIREKLNNGVKSKILENEYGVDQSTISRIKNKKESYHG